MDGLSKKEPESPRGQTRRRRLAYRGEIARGEEGLFLRYRGERTEAES